MYFILTYKKHLPSAILALYYLLKHYILPKDHLDSMQSLKFLQYVHHEWTKAINIKISDQNVITKMHITPPKLFRYYAFDILLTYQSTSAYRYKKELEIVRSHFPLNPSSSNPTKWSNFVELALKRLKIIGTYGQHKMLPLFCCRLRMINK